MRMIKSFVQVRLIREYTVSLTNDLKNDRFGFFLLIHGTAQKNKPTS
jgi:hypothetical protein